MNQPPVETTLVPLETRTVAEVMARGLLTVSSHDSVLMAWELMRRGGYHHLPVVADDGTLLGILDTELLRAHWREGGPDQNDEPVGRLLYGRLHFTVGPNQQVGIAAKLMISNHTDAVAVVDADGRLMGLLTVHDLVSALAGISRQAHSENQNTPSLYRIEPVLPPS